MSTYTVHAETVGRRTQHVIEADSPQSARLAAIQHARRSAYRMPQSVWAIGSITVFDSQGTVIHAEPKY